MKENNFVSCPHLMEETKTNTANGTTRLTGSKLTRLTEIAANLSPDSALKTISDWVFGFLAMPHKDLGRKGSVCPFVPRSLHLDTIFLAVEEGAAADEDVICQIMENYLDLFTTTEPTDGPNAIYKAFIIIFPNLGEDGYSIIDNVQFKMKQHFVNLSLMLGEFHDSNQSPSLHNPDFRPLRSPIPLLAIRNMVDSDLPFLKQPSHPASDRASFLRSYLTKFGGSISPTLTKQALDAYAEAEIEQWVKSAIQLHSNGSKQSLCDDCVSKVGQMRKVP
jgi:hypothetical protein